MNITVDDQLTTRWRTLSRAAGGAVALLGFAVLAGWALNNDALKNVLPGFVSMKANTALLFLFAGVALTLQPGPVASGRGRITQTCAVFVLAVSLLTLIEQLTGVDLKIDELLFTDPDTPRDLFPGRMAVATAVAFLFASIVLLITPVAVRATHLATLARGLTICVIIIGVLGIIGYALDFEILYNWYVYKSVYAYGSVALHTAAGFTVLGAGLWATGQAGAWPSRVRTEDERIARIAAWLLVLAAGAAGIAGFSTLQSEVERSYGQGLQVALDARVQQISTNIALRVTRTQIITTRPNLLKHLRLLITDPGNAEYRKVVQGVVESFIPHGFTAIAISLPGGGEIARVGEFVAAPAVEIPLDGSVETTLLWHEGIYLRNRLPLHDVQGNLGTVVTEQFLPNLTATLLKTEAGGKDTIEFQLCRPETKAFHCFPTRLHTEPLFLPLHVEGPPLLAQRALAEGGTGFAVTQDYRGHRVLGAFVNVGPLGLVAALKVDTNEIYQPISRQFQYTLLFIVLLIVGGTLLVRARVRPLAAALNTRATELAAANAALEASEAQFRQVVEGEPNAIVMVDISGRIALVNSETERVFGYKREELLGQPVEVLIPERFRAAHVEHRAGFFADPSVRRMGAGRDLYGQRKDGTEVPVEIGLSPITVAGGSFVLASILNITDRKHAEEQLRLKNEELAEARQTLSDAIEALPDAFAVYDAEGRLVQYNSRFREVITGATPDLMVPGITFEAINRAWAERGLIPAAAGRVDDWVKERMEAFYSGTWTQGALEAGGKFYQIQERRTRPGGTVGVYADVTEHQLAQEAQARLAAVVESSDDAIITKTLEGFITSWNRSAERLFGHSAEEVIGRHISLLIPDGRADEESHIITQLRLGKSIPHYETQRLRKDGTLIDVSLTVSPIRDTHGAITGVSKIARDITKQKILEDQLRRKNEELQAQNLRVQEANRLKSEFLANMSHELRTPLNAIIGFSELMHDGKAGQVSAEQKEYLGDILTSGRHLLQLINDVLDLAKVEAGKMEFHPEPVDLARITGEVRDVLRTMMSHKRINVDVEADAGLTDIMVDPAKFKQILYNYLSNAIKFTPEGGRIVIRTLPRGQDYFRIEVEDSGVGIREEDMLRLFAEFQQIDSGITKKYQGTGLGLALTKRMVEAQGGEIGARSTFGKGSVFYAVLPRRMPVTIESGQMPVPAQRAPQDAPLLLVVDDNRDDLAWLTRVLEEEGYRTEAVTDGARAIARCREKPYDAIVLDLLLPDISGWEVLKTAQEESLNRATPVIVVSVLSDTAKGRAAVQVFLTKPVSREALVQALEQAGVHGGAGNRILVVDDDPKALKLAENMLTELGYSVFAAAGGEQGLALLKHHRPDAVVLDLVMPGMSGFEFLEHLRGSGDGSETPVVVWTVKDLSPEENRRLRIQAHAVVSKGDPKGISSLLETLHTLVPSKILSSHGMHSPEINP